MSLLTELRESLPAVSTKMSPLTGLAERDLQGASVGESKRNGNLSSDGEVNAHQRSDG